MKKYMLISICLHALIMLQISGTNEETTMYKDEIVKVIPKTEEVEISVIEDDKDGVVKKAEPKECPSSYGGIGIEIRGQVIQTVYQGYPAHKAGMLAGDIIMSISGTGEIRGTVGTSVDIVILRNNTEFKLTLTRESICSE